MSSLTRDGAAVASATGHVIVCGLHDEGLRVVEQLVLAGVVVVVLDEQPDPRLVRTLEALAVPYLATDSRNPDALAEAGVANAAAVICAESEDLHTLATALVVHEIAPQARIVVQFRNPAVGRALEDIGVAVLDVARLAAPSIVAACLGTDARSLRLGGETLVLVEARPARVGTIRELYGDLAPVAVLPEGSATPILTPGRDQIVEPGDVVTVIGRPEGVRLAGLRRSPAGRRAEFVSSRAPRRPRNRRAALLSTLARALDRRMKIALTALFGLIGVSVTVLMIGYREPDGTRMSVIDALYFTVETIGTVGFGDFYFRDQHQWLRIWAIVLMLVGATMATVFFALLTNMLISRRIAESFGMRRITGMSEHVVVIGAGSVGVAVIEDLLAQQVPVVAVEASEDNRFLNQLRRQRVPVVIGDATLPETLGSLQLEHARAVAVVTSDDLTNIETGLAIRDVLAARWQRVPVVLRLFDRRLATTLENGFDFRHVRSPAALAAPWFVGAALGLDVLSTFYAGDLPLLVARLQVGADSRLHGLPMRDLPAQVRVVLQVRADGTVELPPRRETVLAAGDQAYLIGPYGELLRLLRIDV